LITEPSRELRFREAFGKQFRDLPPGAVRTDKRTIIRRLIRNPKQSFLCALADVQLFAGSDVGDDPLCDVRSCGKCPASDTLLRKPQNVAARSLSRNKTIPSAGSPFLGTRRFVTCIRGLAAEAATSSFVLEACAMRFIFSERSYAGRISGVHAQSSIKARSGRAPRIVCYVFWLREQVGMEEWESRVVCP